MIQAVAGNSDVPGVVVGIGSEVPARTDPGRFRRTFGVRRPFALYIGRIDENKGCGELFDHFQRYAAHLPARAGSPADRHPVMPVPDAPSNPSSRLRIGPGQVRRAGGGRPPDHAVVLREPLDGRARGVGAGPAGAGERTVRRPEGPVHPEPRGLVLRKLRGVRRSALRARVERARFTPGSDNTGASTSPATTPGRSSSASTWTC